MSEPDDPLARCAREQQACAEEWRADHPEVRGLELGISDWLAEEALLRGSGGDGITPGRAQVIPPRS